MTLKEFISDVQALIAQDRLSEAIQQLQSLLENSPLLDEAIQQSARFNDIRKQIRLGTASQADAELTQNQIRAALLELLREIEKREENPPVREEMEKHAAGVRIIQNADKIYNIGRIDEANFS